MFDLGQEMREGNYGFLTWYFNFTQEQWYFANSIADFLDHKDNLKPNPFYYVTKKGFTRISFQNVQIEKLRKGWKVYDLTDEMKIVAYTSELKKEIEKGIDGRAQYLSIFYNHEKDKIILNSVKKFGPPQAETQSEFNGLESMLYAY